MTNELQNQEGKELAECIKTKHRFQTEKVVTTKTDEDIKAAAQRYINLFVESQEQKND